MDRSKELAEHYRDFVRAWKADEHKARMAFVDVCALPVPERSGDTTRLYATDIGSCPRKAMLRILGKAKRTATLAEELMYDEAEMIEARMAATCLWQDGLVDYQSRVEIRDREGWGARLDIVADYGGLTGIEVKSSRSAAFKFGVRKANHDHQARLYSHYREVPWILFYADRGGANHPEQYKVDGDWSATGLIMDELEACRAALPDLPPVLDKVANERDRKKTVKLEPAWECGYCNYADISCKPLTGIKTLASRGHTDIPYVPKPGLSPGERTILDDYLQKISEG